MLNEVRLKPQKPRIRKDHGRFYCYDESIVRVGMGWTQRAAYENWKKQFDESQNSPSGHK